MSGRWQREGTTLNWLTWAGFVDGATVIGMLVAVVGLPMTYRQSKSANQAATAARSAAEASAGRSAELSLTGLVAELHMHEQILEQACASDNRELARSAISNWTRVARVAGRLAKHIDEGRQIEARPVVSACAAILIATDELLAGETPVQRATGSARKKMGDASRWLQDCATDSRVRPNGPRIRT